MILEQPGSITQAFFRQLVMLTVKIVSDCLVYKMKDQVKLSMYPSQRQALNSDRMPWNCKVRTMVNNPKVANFSRMHPVKLHLSKPLVHRERPLLELENNKPGEKFQL